MKETVLAASLALSLLSSPAFAAETADVVVVGAGAAGLSASIGAAMRGAKVILLEKTGDAGGNTAFAKLGLNAAATPDQAAARITGDSATLFAADTIRYGHQINDAALVRAMTVPSAPALAWLETLGAKLCLRITPVGSEERPRLMAPCDGTAVGPRLIQVLKAKTLESEVDLRTERPLPDQSESRGPRDRRLCRVLVPRGPITPDTQRHRACRFPGRDEGRARDRADGGRFAPRPRSARDPSDRKREG